MNPTSTGPAAGDAIAAPLVAGTLIAIARHNTRAGESGGPSSDRPYLATGVQAKGNPGNRLPICALRRCGYLGAHQPTPANRPGLAMEEMK